MCKDRIDFTQAEDKLGEECGVFGMYDFSGEDVAASIYYGLLALQHRGQESCGIAVSDTQGPKGQVGSVKGMGCVNEVFDADKIHSLKGNIGVGHVRYSTSGQSVIENAQPLVLNYIKGTLALCHNGNLVNAPELRRQLAHDGAIFQTTIDSEVIAYHIARARVHTRSAQEAVAMAMRKLSGAYSLVIMSPRKLIGARDPYGYRPLCIGRRDQAWILASESCALDAIGATFVRDVLPGEIVTMTPKEGLVSDTQMCLPWVMEKAGRKAAGEDPVKARDRAGAAGSGEADRSMTPADGASEGTGAEPAGEGGSLSPDRTQVKPGHCIFEYIYFGRPDSILDGVSVYDARIRAGRYLAMDDPVEADLVTGVPESGNVAALGYAMESGIPYGTAFVKNGYVGRTFIKPGQSSREQSVQVKLNALRDAVAGKRVIMIDDSIVRGTTSDRIVHMLREAGATEVHMRVSSPPFLWPCYFGTDVPAREQLIAYDRSIEEIRQIIGADSLGYLRIERLAGMVKGLPVCTGCFTGVYPSETPTEDIRGEYDH